MKHASFSVFILWTRGGIFQQKEFFFGTHDPAWKHWCKVTARDEVQSRVTRWDAHLCWLLPIYLLSEVQRPCVPSPSLRSSAEQSWFLQSSSSRTTPASNAQLCKQSVSICSCFCWPIVHTLLLLRQAGWFFIDLKDLTETSRCHIFTVFSCYINLVSVPALPSHSDQSPGGILSLLTSPDTLCSL